MSNAFTGGSAFHRPSPRDEVGTRHNDENGDDITANSLTGLALEVEVPREVQPPPKPAIGTVSV